MSFTYVKVTTLSPIYLDAFYAKHPGLDELSHAEQFARINEDAHFWADDISRHLRGQGVDAHEILYNCDPLQQAWAREHGSQASGMDLLMEQLRALRPDMVFLHVSYPLYKNLVGRVRSEVPTVRSIQGNICVGFGKEHFPLFRSLDFVLTCDPGLCQRLKEAGANPYHIYHGFEHGRLPRVRDNAGHPERDVLFAGSLVMSDHYHLRRREALSRLVDLGVDLDILCNPVEVRHQTPDSLRPRMRPGLYGIEMLRALSRARIVFNIHIDAVGGHASNLRLFEATGVGSCLVTDRQEDLGILFQEDVEVAAYSSPEECAEKIRWLLDHPAERQAMAAAGQHRTLAEHRLEQRVELMHDMLHRELARAPRRQGQAAMPGQPAPEVRP